MSWYSKSNSNLSHLQRLFSPSRWCTFIEIRFITDNGHFGHSYIFSNCILCGQSNGSIPVGYLFHWFSFCSTVIRVLRPWDPADGQWEIRSSVPCCFHYGFPFFLFYVLCWNSYCSLLQLLSGSTPLLRYTDSGMCTCRWRYGRK